MWAPSTIGIDNNFSTGEAGVSSWTSYVKLARWVDNDLSTNQHVLWYDLLDNFLGQNLGDLLVGNLWGVLGRDQNIVNTDWLQDTLWLLLIFDNDLRFAIWSQPWDLAILSLDGHDLAKLVCKDVGVWVEGDGVPLVGGVTEHETLITGAHIELILVSVDGSGNVGILSVHVDNDIALIGVETDLLAGETNFLADSSGNLLEVDLRLVNANFSKKNNLNIEKN